MQKKKKRLKCDMFICGYETNHSFYATQVLAIIVKYRPIDAEGNKMFPAFKFSSYSLPT